MGCRPGPTTSPSTATISGPRSRSSRGRGVEFDGDVVDAGFGLMTHFGMPGGVRVMLYQPHYRKGAG